MWRERERGREKLTGICTYAVSDDRSLSVSLSFLLSMSILFTRMSRLPMLSFFLCPVFGRTQRVANMLLCLMIILHDI